MSQCSQCEKPAIVDYNGHPLCVEHYRMMVQASHSILSWQAANLNMVRSELEAEAGGFVRLPRIEIPPNPFVGGNLTYNNINVDRSTIGAINTGTISSLDVAITMMKDRGENELAEAIKELTEAVIGSNEINDTIKNEINEQLEFLVAQATTKSQNRSMGTVKSVFAGIRNYVAPIASLLTIWNKAEPLIKAALGIS
jgi:hypothetical protein